MKGIPAIVVVAAVGLLLAGGAMVWQKSQIKTEVTRSKTPAIKKVDLATQPAWVQKLKAAARKGTSANGLENVALIVSGLPKGEVETISYVLQYQTSNKGAQGAMSSIPVEVRGATEFSKTIDLGTCSTKSCVRHEGVTSVEVELDFVTSSGGEAVWTGIVNL
jgi:hypothetical protein